MTCPAEEHYRLLFEQNPQPMWVLDRSTLRFLAVNEAALRHYGYSREEFLALSARDIRPPDDWPCFLRYVEELAAAGATREPDRASLWRHRRKDGSLIEVEITAGPLPFAGRDGLLVVAHDVTERRRTEEALRDSEERQRLISELTSDYAYTARVDPEGRIEIEGATEGFRRVTGYTVEELELRGGWPTLVHPDDLAAAQEKSALLLAGERHVNELRILTREGQTRWIRYSIHPIWDEARRRVVRLLGAAQDITRRKRDEERLQEYAQRLQGLSRRLMEVQEQERRFLARELHDEVGQVLTALRLALERGEREAGPGGHDSLREALGLVRDLTARARDLSLRLRPTMLDDLGLLPALLWYLDGYTTRTRVRVQFQHRGLDRRLEPDVETAAFRIVQEALTNVARHAGVAEAAVRLWRDDGTLFLQVEDRGVGFEPAAVQARGASGGLSGMQERAALLGGRLTVESVPAWGTQVAAELPAPGLRPKGCADADAVAGR